MPQLDFTVALPIPEGKPVLQPNAARLWITIQSKGPGQVTIKSDKPPQDMDDGDTIQPAGLFADAGEGVHEGSWYVLTDVAGTKIHVTEASK